MREEGKRRKGGEREERGRDKNDKSIKNRYYVA